MFYTCPDRRNCMGSDNPGCRSSIPIPFLGTIFNYKSCPVYRHNHDLDKLEQPRQRKVTFGQILDFDAKNGID